MNVFDKVQGATHIVAESSRLKATTAGHIVDLEMIADTDNGSIVAVGAHVEGQVFKAAAYAAGKTPYLVLTPPLAYNGKKSWSDEKYFYNATGEIARAYELCIGDIYTVSANAFDKAPAVGNFVGADYKVVTSAPSTGFVGEIIEEVVYANSTSYRVLVTKL